MKFFVPQSKKSQYEASYSEIISALKDQMRWTVSERKIFSLSYTHDKKDVTLEVGKLDPRENRYEIVAILESPSVYMVFSKVKNGTSTATILVNKDEVYSVTDFD